MKSILVIFQQTTIQNKFIEQFYGLEKLGILKLLNENNIKMTLKI